MEAKAGSTPAVGTGIYLSIIKANNVEQPTKQSVLKAWREATADGRKLLSNLYGALTFSDKLTDRIKTFEDVLCESGENGAEYLVRDIFSNQQKADVQLKRLKLIAQVFNGTWKANLANTSQYKHYPWFKIVPDSSKPSGFGLSYRGCDCADSISFLGVRPYFKNSSDAVYVGQQFLAEYEAYAQYLNECE